ncbi:condensin subunit ScpA [Thermoanaerobacter uzonensis DSM 18761]|uniref:Segregation and condensation protein A n=2 Tax=Thermoanaerobacter uzonensis TaxID=447593 RepID=A0A1M4V484_9THEO|nr:condensin subunit ScpA [Thermoanaerobacter uzonensis DSM 18761]
MKMYNVKLEVFEGPFDLLFHLIEKNEIDLMDIPISVILDQYMEYIKTLQEMDLDVASEFIVMAATLLEIKSKMLLPKQQFDGQQLEIEEVDPREELVTKLIEYKKYKIIAQTFREMCKIGSRFFREEPEIKYIDKKIALNYSSEDIYKAYLKVISKNNARENEIEIKKDEYTVEIKIKELLVKLVKKPFLWFSEFIKKSRAKGEIIISFIAVLELVRLNKIIAEQKTTYGDILIKSFRRGEKNEL